MELLTLKVTPLSYFGTLPKGDTIFGQILAYLFLKGDTTFSNYLNEDPKLIVSDMMPYGYIYKPYLPLQCFKESDTKKVLDKKEIRKKKFITIENLQNGNLHLCEKVDFFKEFVTIKNSINRTSFGTDGAEFAPYGIEEKNYFRQLWMFVLVESAIKDKVLETIEEIGTFGFGKDANLGKGHFEVKIIDTPIKPIQSQYAMSISPVLLNDDTIIKAWYEPFLRFGKYGLHNANTNAFKKPTLMADSSTVVKLSNTKHYVGNCINNGIDNKPSFLQGYSIAIPFLLKDELCISVK